MAGGYDVIVIGGGLGGLIAAGLVARAERKTLLIERNHDVGGAATTYKAGGLVVEASLHETSDPRDPIHHVLTRLGVLDDIDWIPTGAIYEVRGGLLGEPFCCPRPSRRRGTRFWNVSIGRGRYPLRAWGDGAHRNGCAPGS